VGIGDRRLRIKTTPTSPIPNPQSPIPKNLLNKLFIKNNKNIFILFVNLN
jgi:hypothetical protein